MWGAIIGAVASIAGGALSSSGARSAANTQAASADAAIAEQQRQYDIARGDLAPYRQMGTQALNQLGSLYGFTPYSAPPDPVPDTGVSNALAQLFNVPNRAGGSTAQRYAYADSAVPSTNVMRSGGQQQATPNGMEGFWTSPDYNFRRTEGTRGIEQSAAARGGALSGNAIKAAERFSSDLASTEFGNYFNRLAGLAGIGQTATNSGNALGADYASNIGGLLIGQGNARASGTLGSYNSWGNAITGVGNALSDWYSNRGPAFNQGQYNSWSRNTFDPMFSRNPNGLIVGG